MKIDDTIRDGKLQYDINREGGGWSNWPSPQEKLPSKSPALLGLKYFMNTEKKLSNCLMIVLKLYLKLNTKQNIEKDSKY